MLGTFELANHLIANGKGRRGRKDHRNNSETLRICSEASPHIICLLKGHSPKNGALLKLQVSIRTAHPFQSWSVVAASVGAKWRDGAKGGNRSWPLKPEPNRKNALVWAWGK